MGDLRPLPVRLSALEVVQHRDRVEPTVAVTADLRPLLTVHFPVGVDLFRDLVATVRRHHPEVVTDGRGDTERLLVSEEAVDV